MHEFFKFLSKAFKLDARYLAGVVTQLWNTFLDKQLRQALRLPPEYLFTKKKVQPNNVSELTF